MTRMAKLFQTGGSQAVRLPADCRFAGDAVYVRRDPLTGDVILSAQPPRLYAAFMATRDALAPLPEGFLSRGEREPKQEPVRGTRPGRKKA